MRIKFFRTNRLQLLLFICLTIGCDQQPAPIQIFSTGGYTLYHIQPASVNNNKERALIGAAYDGSVLCLATDGKLIWKAKTGKGFPFDLSVNDIDADGLDDILVASSDGALYCFNATGQLQWTFANADSLPLYQVCAAKQKDGKAIVLTGGVNDTLYSLSNKGVLMGKLSAESHITHIRAGDILGTGNDMVALTTSTGALAGKLSLSLIDPVSLQRIWKHDSLGTYAPNSGRRFFSMAIADVNKDHKADILLSDSWGEHGKIFAFDQKGEKLFEQSDNRIPDVPYRMNILVPVHLPNDNFIIGQFGNILIVYNQDGSCREVVTGPYSYANAAFDATTQTLYCGSAVSGGDEWLAIHLNQPGWQKAFEQAKPVGKLARIIANMDTLKNQIASFRAPSYQPESRHAEVLLLDEYHLRTPEELRKNYHNSDHIRYVSHLVLTQKPEPGALWCRDISSFGNYDMTADEIVQEAEKWETKGLDFVIQAGHTTALHMSPETFERVLKAAPHHLWGFEFSEIGGQLDSREEEVVEKIMLTLADQCRRYGNKKILLRTKNIFWNGNIYVPFWKKILLNQKYRDIFVPCLEETNSRTQELSLAGRLGLWQTGVFDHWACRAETDNACFNRSWEWSSQQVFSHLFRNLVSCASMGSDIYFNSIHQGPFSEQLEKQLFPFYEMLEKGIVFIPQRDEIASLSNLAIGMKSPPSSSFLRHGTNGTRTIFSGSQPPLVFDRLDWYWGGAPLEPYDFSHYALGTARRMCNFLPVTPYGMPCIVPETVNADIKNPFKEKIITDGELFYDAQGVAHSPMEYKKFVVQALQKAALELPIRVEGPAHWSAAWLDKNHLRITLIDPGYLDPADRDVSIVLQQQGWTACRDILRNQAVPIQNSTVHVHIPMGTLRIIDLIKE